MFHIDGTQCDGDPCDHWSHGDKPLTLAEMKAKMRMTAEREGWV